MSNEPPDSGADRRRAELRDFLRTRRARLAPADVGMPAGGRRRTPGLRREEVAVLAGVGVSWYTWLEQGRDIKVSGEVLDAIARALRLDAAEREHLYLLAGLNPPPAEGTAAGGAVSPELRRVLEAWAPRPAYVRDRHWNFLAINDAAREVFGYGDTDRNCLVTFFTNGIFRAMSTEWAEAAPGVVARFRADSARHPDDPEFGRLADGLRAACPEFAELWARHDVSAGTDAVKAIRHPEAGELVFDALALPLADRPGLSLILHHPRPGTGTEERLERHMEHRRLSRAS
ncbi:helix-turn-helix transcriptional regulator [Actinomadura parmotrematis]|uniref:Helix-turn-helix transcriptional regulator n=1 Tax=Actinomadura parmotrematis TaxID=2864039 RepID=A0ABS7G0E5_9ACTN|nr:helix-turn-helix transcriptional regulator [Actinomadura parmotrematis]MBW8486179.1 helix-turn-helix transcriptional regulator [Actinomadura parmotrematis]